MSKTSENLDKIPKNTDKNGTQRSLNSNNGVQPLQKNTIKTFFWRSHQKQVFMFFVGENLWAKGAQKLFGQVWGNSGKNPSHPRKFACSYTYVRGHSLFVFNITHHERSRSDQTESSSGGLN